MFYQQAINKDESVADCFASGQWHIRTQGALTEQVRQQLLQLQAQLQDFIPSQEEDTVIWIRHSTGKFSSKSAYPFITGIPAVTTGAQHLWSIPAPPRVQIFIWLKTQNKILTFDNLIKRGWQMTNICYMCRSQEETVRHLFHECSFVIQFRSYIQGIMSFSMLMCQLFTSIESSQLVLSKQHDGKWRQLEMTTVFVLWRERCKRILRDESQNLVCLAREIFREHRD
jgi:zinc-binding in reverse transcriptase